MFFQQVCFIGIATFNFISPPQPLTLLPNFNLILKVEVNGNKQDASNWNCSITCLSGWLCSKCNTMYSREGKKLEQAEVFTVCNFTVVSLLRFCFLFFFVFVFFPMATCHIHLD